MFLTRSEYGRFFVWLVYALSYSNRDRGVNTFSPEGRLFQGTKLALIHET
jgi:proteasome subunit A (alpha)-like protein